MRLTLRTLLAYLDDTLEPAEIKQIGQKVAESDAAQELIARIKQITRRRRLTTPPTQGPGAANFDPNTVAEYLDNALSAEQLAEIEKICLESDVHLAEIASCHQILTLVLGEPALVPPTARERMYGLVQGKESIPYRKATAVTNAPAHPAAALATGADADRDDTLLLGLPFYRRQGSWLRWALPAAGLLLVAGLAVALWKAMPDPRPVAVAAAAPASSPATLPPPPASAPAKPADDNVGKGKPDGDKVADAGKPANAGNGGNSEKPEKKPDPPAGQNPPADASAAAGPPAAGRVRVGIHTGSPSILLKHTGKDGAAWERLKLGDAVYTSEPLVSLPGFASEVRLEGKVSLLLRGHLREFSLVPETNDLLECAAVLHPPAAGVDADVTLDRGRLYLANRNRQGAVVVRLRFEGEIWDVTLEDPDSEVGVDLFRRYNRLIDWQGGEEPLAALFLFAVKGRVGVKENYRQVVLTAPPGNALLSWDNKGKGGRPPIPLKEAPPAFDRRAPATELAKGMEKALNELATRMVGDKPVDRVLLEGTQSDVLQQRQLSVYALGAVDEVRKLFDVLGNEEPTHVADRGAAIFTLRHWIARSGEYGNYLYDPKTKKGLLTENKQFSPNEAAILLELLHDYSPKLRNDPEIYRSLAYYLQSERHAVRELAWYQLGHMSYPVKLPDYNPAWPAEDRAKVAEEVNKLVEAKKLPPTEGAAPAPPPGPPQGGTPGKAPPPPRGAPGKSPR